MVYSYYHGTRYTVVYRSTDISLVSSFVLRINTPFMDYNRRHKTKLHVSDLAALTRAIVARGA